MNYKPIDNNTPQGIILKTCIIDQEGVRMEQELIRKGNLWFFTDMSMYVYYKPTHFTY